MADDIKDEVAMPARARRKRGGKAEGGRADGSPTGNEKPQVYNAVGSAAMDSAKNETPGFKKGGHKKRADGGVAEGAMAPERLDRRPRRAAGGRAGSHSPYSSASSFEGPTSDSAGKGYENVSGRKKT